MYSTLQLISVSSRSFCKRGGGAKINFNTFAGASVNNVQSKRVLVTCKWQVRWDECPTLPHPELNSANDSEPRPLVHLHCENFCNSGSPLSGIPLYIAPRACQATK